MVVMMRDGSEHLLLLADGEAMQAALAGGVKLIDVYGDGEVIIDRSAIAQVLSDEAYEVTYNRRPKAAAPEIDIRPIEPLPRTDIKTSPETAWKREVLGAMRRHGAGSKLDIGSGKTAKWLMWPPDEATFRLWESGEAEWPERTPGGPVEPRAGVPARYVKRSMTDKHYEKNLAGRPGHYVIGRQGTDVIVAYTKIWQGGAKLEHDEDFVTEHEFGLIEERRTAQR